MTDPQTPPRTPPPASDSSDPLPGGRTVRHYMRHRARALFGAETVAPMLVFVLGIIVAAMLGGFGGTTTVGLMILVLAFIAGAATDYALWTRRQTRP